MTFERFPVVVRPARRVNATARGSMGVDATATARRRALGEAPREADLTTAGRRLPARTILNDPLLRQAYSNSGRAQSPRGSSTDTTRIRRGCRPAASDGWLPHRDAG